MTSMTDVGSGSLSCSKARLLLPPSCPAKYRQSLREDPVNSVTFDFGKLVHLMVLGTGDEVVEIDAANFKTAAARAAQQQAWLEGKVPVLPSWIETASLMAEAVTTHPVAGKLLASGHAEHPITVDDPVTGVSLSGRLDWLTMQDDVATIVDLKTAADASPSQWVRKAWDYGYVLQNAWYVTLAKLAGVDTHVRFLFVVVEKVPPYVVSVIEFDERTYDFGCQQMRQAIDTYVTCRRDDVWPGYDEIATVGLPGWIYR